MSFFASPLFIGGIIPMFGFGLYNYFWKDVSWQLSIAEIFFSIAFVCIVTACVATLFFDSPISQVFISIPWWKACIITLLWVGAILGLIFGFKLGGTVSLMLPIVSAGALVSVGMALMFTDEKITWNIIAGTCLIVAGAGLVVWKSS